MLRYLSDTSSLHPIPDGYCGSIGCSYIKQHDCVKLLEYFIVAFVNNTFLSDSNVRFKQGIKHYSDNLIKFQFMRCWVLFAILSKEFKTSLHNHTNSTRFLLSRINVKVQAKF